VIQYFLPGSTADLDLLMMLWGNARAAPALGKPYGFTFEERECELVFDDDGTTPIAVVTPAGLMWIQSTS
jgi:hypothetical protein